MYKFSLSQLHKIERQIAVQSIRHPLIISIHQIHQNAQRIYILSEYFPNGDLEKYVSKIHKVSEPVAQFIIAQLVLTLRFLHEEMQVIHRNLLMENIYITSTGYIKLGGFSQSKKLKSARDLTYSMTNQQLNLAPEVLQGLGHNFASDLWQLGVLLYHLLHGKPPFDDQTHSPEHIKLTILNTKPAVADDITEAAKDLILSLMAQDPKRRIGASSYDDLVKHPFLATLEWNLLQQQKLPSPLLAVVRQVKE